MPKNLKKTKLKELREYFKEKEEVRLAYLFGSAAKGEITKLSDIDIGVFLDESLSDSEMFNLQLKIMGDTSSILGTDKIDLVVMNETGYSINYEIIKSNSPIFVRNKSEKVELECKIMSEHLDKRYYDLRSCDMFLDKAANKGLNF